MILQLRLTEDELEDVVVDEPLALGILNQLESLRVVHGALLLVNLVDEKIRSQYISENVLTNRQRAGIEAQGESLPRAGQSRGS